MERIPLNRTDRQSINYQFNVEQYGHEELVVRLSFFTAIFNSIRKTVMSTIAIPNAMRLYFIKL